MTYQHDTNQINQLADKLEDPEIDTYKGLGWKAAFHLRELQGRIAELETMLDAVGAGGVGQSIKPQVQADTAQKQLQEPFGYFKAMPFGWTDCDKTDEGAIALYEAPQQPVQADTVIQVSVPTGWKLVPVEPTDDMFIEGMEADCRGRPSIDDDNHVRSIWRAMLSSAPDAPQQPVQQKPVAWIEVKPNPFDPSCRGAASVQDHALPPGEHKLYTAPQPTENLHCKSTQKRLATLWGYVKKEPDHFRDATQMVPARQPLTEEHIYRLYSNAMRGYWVESFHHWRLKKRNEAREFARAVEAAVAKQPDRQPLTEEQQYSVWSKLFGPKQDRLNKPYNSYVARESFDMVVAAVEAAHGITGGQP